MSNNILERLLASDFFIDVLLRSISLVDFGRLRILNRTQASNQKLSYGNCIEFLSKSNTFRRAVFHSKLEIIEKVIILYSKQKQTQPESIPFFPKAIMTKLIESCCEANNISLMKLIYSNFQELFPFSKIQMTVSVGLRKCVENKHFEFIQFKLNSQPLDDDEKFSILSEALELAYRDENWDKNFTLLLLEECAKIDPQMNELLKQIKIATTTTTTTKSEKSVKTNNSDDFYVEWLFSLTSYTYNNRFSILNLFSILHDLSQLENLKQHEFIEKMHELPIVMPLFFIEELEKISFKKNIPSKLVQNWTNFMRRRWFLFVYDFPAFQNSVSDVQQLLSNMESTTDWSTFLLAFVVIRCVDRPQKTTQFFDHCMNIFEKQKLLTFQFSNLLHYFQMAIAKERLNLVERLRKAILEQYSLDILKAVTFSEQTAKFMMKHKMGDVDSSRRRWYYRGAYLESGDLDLLRKQFETNNSNFIDHFCLHFAEILAHVIFLGDFGMVQYFLSLREQFPNVINREALLKLKTLSHLKNQARIFKYIDSCFEGKIKGWE